jgi:hypothetical protein
VTVLEITTAEPKLLAVLLKLDPDDRIEVLGQELVVHKIDVRGTGQGEPWRFVLGVSV